MEKFKSFGIWLVVTVLLTIIVVFSCDYLTYLHYKNIEVKRCKAINLPYLYKYSLLSRSGIEDIKNNEYRKPYGLQYKKPPIYVFGCSFAYGQYLDEKYIFSTLLSDLTKRPVYNRAVTGGSFAHMYYQIANNKINFAKTKPDSVIYIMIREHIRRNNTIFFSPLDSSSYLRYENKNNKLELVTNPHKEFFALTLYKVITCYQAIEKSFNFKNEDKNFDLINAYLVNSKKIINQQSPNTKMILLLYGNADEFSWIFTSDRIKKLESEGIMVVMASQFTTKPLDEMVRPDEHPTKEAWAKITPNFVKYFNL